MMNNTVKITGIMFYEDNGILTTLGFCPSNEHSFDDYEKY